MIDLPLPQQIADELLFIHSVWTRSSSVGEWVTLARAPYGTWYVTVPKVANQCGDVYFGRQYVPCDGSSFDALIRAHMLTELWPTYEIRIRPDGDYDTREVGGADKPAVRGVRASYERAEFCTDRDCLALVNR